jgi:hypothetical protein
VSQTSRLSAEFTCFNSGAFFTGSILGATFPQIKSRFANAEQVLEDGVLLGLRLEHLQEARGLSPIPFAKNRNQCFHFKVCQACVLSRACPCKMIIVLIRKLKRGGGRNCRFLTTGLGARS